MPFDHFIVIDWSARSAPSPAKPHRDAIWLCEGAATDVRKKTKYFRTRIDCYNYLVQRLERLVEAEKRVLVGFDLNFAYPKGTAKAMRLKEKPRWRAIWELLHQLVEDDKKNRNNRFRVGGDLNRRIKAPLGPFWGVPSGQSGIFLGPKKDFTYPVVTKRASLAERRLVETRHAKMQPGWKLAYTGSVGSQAIMGIPYLYRLRFLEKKLKDHGCVWPFESGFSPDPLSAAQDLILYTEIWPSLVDRPKKDKIPDREQVRVYLDWLRRRQAANRLAKLLDRPAGLTDEQVRDCVREEGWVLGG